MKRFVAVALPFVRLLLTQLLILAAVCAAPHLVFFQDADNLGGDGMVVAEEAGKGTARFNLVNGSRVDISRSRTCPITITKSSPLTKTFGHVCNDNKNGPVFLLQATPSITGRAPKAPHRPRPAGRSP